MKLNEVYKKGKQILIDTNNESAEFDAMCIFELCFNINKQKLILNGYNEALKKDCDKFFDYINQRAEKRPLQYILKNWNFMDLIFEVGEGVLIPREETGVLVDECLKKIQNKESPIIFDLCAGSGAVSISIADKRNDAKVFAIELSDIAYSYLCKNIKINKVDNVIALKYNILEVSALMQKLKIEKIDAIVSNPPYIPHDDLYNLQEEVKREPIMALDGGKDGLDFYRDISKLWIPYLKNDGLICVELGINQETDVFKIFNSYGLEDIKKTKDINGIYRVISAVKGNK